MRTSGVPIGIRILAVVAGGIVILIGLIARSVEEEYGPPSYAVEQLGERAVAYDIDDMTGFQLEELTGDRARVLEGNQIVFEGTSFQAHAWLRERTHTVVYEGTIEEVQTWVADQRQTGKDMLFPNLLIGAGATVAIAGFALGWERRGPSVPSASEPARPLPPPSPPRSDLDARTRAAPNAGPRTPV